MKMTQLTKNEHTVVLAALTTIRDWMEGKPPPERVPNVMESMDGAIDKVKAGPMWVLELEADERERLTEIFEQGGFSA